MPRKDFHWAWVILAICFLDLSVNYSIRLGFGILLPVMIQSLHLNRTEGATILNFYFATYTCLTPFVGNLTDRYGARRIITLFCIALGVGTLLMGTAKSFWTASMFFTLAGAGASAMWVSVLTVTQKWFDPKKRGMALGILSTGYGFGYAAMGIVFPIIVESFSWRFCWYLLGSWAIGMVLLNGIFLRSRPEDLHVSPWGREPGSLVENMNTNVLTKEGQYAKVFKSSLFWSIGVSYFFIACAHYIVATFMVDYVNLELGFSFKKASFLATIRGLTTVVGVLTIPVLSDRIGRKVTLLGSNMFVALSILGIILSGICIPALFTSIALFGIFSGAIWPLYAACAGDYFRKEVMATVIGGWTPFYGLAAILAHFIGGRIRDITQSYQAAFCIALFFAVCAAFLMLTVKRPANEI
ncbi:MAG: MFS transporter [Thermodesulfobacteriota bacterium]|jgi:MFS family permease